MLKTVPAKVAPAPEKEAEPKQKRSYYRRADKEQLVPPAHLDPSCMGTGRQLTIWPNFSAGEFSLRVKTRENS